MTGKSKGRAPTPEERELFEDTLKDAKPLKKRPRTAKSRAANKVTPGPSAKTAELAVPAARGRNPAGLDGNTAQRLSRGEIEPEARLDLHGMTEIVAHRALVTFLRAASARKYRLILVVTGKGGKPPSLDEPFDLGLDSRARGVLRKMTPRWLAEPELARFVADVRSSHRRHGGDGALYVYLRKSR